MPRVLNPTLVVRPIQGIKPLRRASAAAVLQGKDGRGVGHPRSAYERATRTGIGTGGQRVGRGQRSGIAGRTIRPGIRAGWPAQSSFFSAALRGLDKRCRARARPSFGCRAGKSPRLAAIPVPTRTSTGPCGLGAMLASQRAERLTAEHLRQFDLACGRLPAGW
jgi:hypothetical protein